MLGRSRGDIIMKTRYAGLFALVVGLWASTAQAQETIDVLFYGPGGESSCGFFSGEHTCTSADADEWLSYTTEDFAQYDVIWVGDNRCSPVEWGTLIASQDVWAPAVTGRVVVT